MQAPSKILDIRFLSKNNSSLMYGNESDKKKASFSIATSDSYKNQKGEKVEDTQWHNIVIWGKLADTAGKYLKKGMKVFVSGELVKKEWEKDGVKHNDFDIFLDNVQMLDPKEKTEGSSTASSTATSTKPASTPNATPGDLDF